MAASNLIVVTEQKELVNEIVRKAAALPPGQGAGQVGPVIDQLALDRITKYIDDAESKYDAKILLDGRSWTKKYKDGYWIGPTVILHSKESGFKDPAFCDEIFGPTLSILEVDSKERAIEIENGNPYGNAAAIYTTVGANAEWFAARFSVGMVGVNIGVPVPREPFSFGGWNRSRFGDCDITGGTDDTAMLRPSRTCFSFALIVLLSLCDCCLLVHSDGGMEFFTKRKKITTKWNLPAKRGAGDWMA
jgi:acyl-CoA reductase-like NAD-dependent aldehyde dehydrogenase